MSIGTTLADELRTVASRLETPPPPGAAELVREAERQRVRRRLRTAGVAGVAAAAALAAILAGSQVGRPSSAPPPTAPAGRFSVGAQPHVYVDPDHAVLYLDGNAVSGTWRGAETFGDLVVGYQGKGDLGTATIFRGDHEVGQARHVVMDVVRVSPDLRTLSWMEQTGGSAHLIVAEATDRLRELGRLPIDPRVLTIDDEGAERVQAVGNDRTVTYGGILARHSWQPGSAPTDLPVPPPGQGTPGFPGGAFLVMLNQPGTWGAWVTDHRGNALPADLDPVHPADGVTFQQPGRPGTRFTIAMPPRDARLVQGGLYWETDSAVILTVYDDADGAESHLVRCTVLHRTCEYAPAPGAP